MMDDPNAIQVSLRRADIPLYLLVILMCLSGLSGCIGAGYIATVHHTYSCVVIQDNQTTVRGVVCDTQPTPTTQTDIISKLGNPNVRHKQGNHTILEYNREMAVRGVLLQAVIVPIPLMIPWGSRSILFFLDDQGQTVKVESYDGKLKGGFCGFLLAGHFAPGIGCVVHNQCAEKERENRYPNSETGSVNLCESRMGTW